jgi:DNA-binding NtrC family response regulator
VTVERFTTADGWSCFLVANGPRMQAVHAALASFASEDRSILVYGESGAGAGVLCDWAHARSRRADGPLVMIHPQAVPTSSHEEMFFGAGGARGALERAERGTLLVRAFDELEVALQRRVLAHRGEHRLVATLWKGTRAAVEATIARDVLAAFDEIVAIPPLRERPEDLAELSSLIWEDCASARRLDPPPLTSAHIERLRTRDWPGNVRELRNTLVITQYRWESSGSIDL